MSKSSLTSWFIILVAGLLIPGCVYIPPLGRQFTEEARNQIVVGTTTKAQVRELLGKPDLLEDERFHVYAAIESAGLLIFIAPAPGGGIFPVPLDLKHYLVLLEFDDRNVVKRYELEAAKEMLYEGAIPVERTPRPPLGERKLAFTGEGSDLFGFRTGVGFTSVAFSPDGKLLAGGGFKLVGWALSSKRIWVQDLATRQLRTIETADYDRLVFSPDFTRVALLKRSVRILNLETRNTLAVFSGHGDSSFWTLEGASCLAFDPQSSFVATGGYRGRVKIWDSRTGKEVRSLQAHDGAVVSIAYSPDGRWIATSGRDRMLKLWDPRRAQELAAVKGIVGAVRFSPRGDLLAVNRGNHVEIWQINLLKGAAPPALGLQLLDVFLLPYFGPKYPIDPTVDFSPDGNSLAASNGALVIYDIRNRLRTVRLTPLGQIFHYLSSNDAVWALSFSPDGAWLAAGTNLGVYLWSTRFQRE